MSERCVFNRAWVGRCEKGAVPGKNVCAEHSSEKCWCGAQATRQCPVASSFVCGAPLCDEHECRNVSGGLTGSRGFPHSKNGQRQYAEWKEAQDD